MTLGVAVDQDETSREIVASFCGEIVLRECLAAGAGKNTKIPPPIADEKRLAKEQATLREVEAIAAMPESGRIAGRDHNRSSVLSGGLLPSSLKSPRSCVNSRDGCLHSLRVRPFRSIDAWR